MIRWNNDQYRLAHTVATAIIRMISMDEVTTEAVADIREVSAEDITAILLEDPPGLSPHHLRACFIALDLSPLFVLTEEGETHFKTDSPTGRILEALNTIIADGKIESLPKYFRLLGITDERDYMKLCMGHSGLDAKAMLRICQEYNINPAYVWAPQPESPVFV